MRAPKVVVTIPTFNERENMEKLIEQLFGLGIPNLFILIVDDNSPDGTGEIVRRLIPAHAGELALVCRSGEAGRGLAGREGFLEALRLQADYIVEMDGDFSHQPKDLPRLLAAAQGCDVVIGSRMVAGGTDLHRPAWRRHLTRAANLYAREMLRLPVLDTNSGFRCFTRAAMARINPATLMSGGPSIVHEVVFRAIREGLTIHEIPIEFIDRRYGRSKLNLFRLAAGYFWILRLRFRSI